METDGVNPDGVLSDEELEKEFGVKPLLSDSVEKLEEAKLEFEKDAAPETVQNRLDGEVYTFKFGEREFKVIPNKDAPPIDENNLSREFVNQSSLYTYIAVLTAKGESAVKRTKVELEEAEARADDIVRTRFEQAGRKTTESMVASQVTLNPDVMSAKLKYLQAQEEYALLRAMEESLKVRADMLKGIGFLQQSEMGMTGMHVKTPLQENPSEIMRKKLAKARQGENGEV